MFSFTLSLFVPVCKSFGFSWSTGAVYAQDAHCVQPFVIFSLVCNARFTKLLIRFCFQAVWYFFAFCIHTFIWETVGVISTPRRSSHAKAGLFKVALAWSKALDISFFGSIRAVITFFKLNVKTLLRQMNPMDECNSEYYMRQAL